VANTSCAESQRGFSLLEVLVAMSILIAAVCTLTQVSLVAAAVGARARTTTMLALAARQKLEQLRALPWGAPELQPSSPDTISEDVAGYVEYLGWDLRPLPGTPSRPQDAAIVCRWSVVPIDGGGSHSTVIHVAAVPVSGGGAVHLVTVRAAR
jgi:type II secretory pathway pseudopilin PulG